MLAGSLYFFGVFILFCANVLAWLSNLLLLPGNWIVVGLTAAFVAITPADAPRHITWTTVAILLGCAALGELVEFAAGSLGAAKQGASKRAMALALLGAFAGSAAGIAVGAPIPVAGSIVGALLGAALGAFAGAYAGERWKERTHEKAVDAGMAALFGRLLGTVGKLAIGAAMVAIATADAVWK